MIEVAYIIGLAMALVNIAKKRLHIPKDIVPVLSVLFAIILNIGNAVLYGGDLASAGKDAFVSAGILIGLFAASDKPVTKGVE
jgi:hypothetical protein